MDKTVNDILDSELIEDVRPVSDSEKAIRAEEDAQDLEIAIKRLSEITPETKFISGEEVFKD